MKDENLMDRMQKSTVDHGDVQGHDDGTKRALEPHLQVLRLQGSWHDMGRQYGKLLQEELRRTLEWANRCGNEASDSFFSPAGSFSGMDFMDDFAVGVSETSGLTMKELIRANGVEVAYGNQLTDLLQKGGRCGALALDPSRSLEGKLVFCRNYDWLPSFQELDLVVCMLQPDQERPLVSINFAGCFYLTTGMNGAGLFVELNSGAFASGDMCLEQRQNAWELWQVLRQASTVAEGLKSLEAIPAAACYLIGLGDPARSALFEWSVNQQSRACGANSDGCLAFTNHFVRPGWENLPLAAAGGMASSLARRQALVNLARHLPAKASLQDLQRLMEVEVSQGGARWSGTLFQVMAIPEDRSLLIRCKESAGWHHLDCFC